MKTDPWEQNLRDAASRLRNETPEGLEQRISRAVAATARPEKPAAVFRLPMIALALAACAAVALYVSHRPATAAAPVLAATSPAAADEVAETDAGTAPDEPGLLQQDPLQNEADAAYSDARSAVNFLAANFLPSAPGDAAEGNSTPKT